jgi:starch-binding outer membrane protein, SusD/RagB family
LETDARSLFSHNYTSSHRFVNFLWESYFRAIRDANIVIASIEDASFNENFSEQKTAEAKFIRGLAYTELLKNYGATPIPTHPEDIVMPRASLDEMKTLIEDDLQAAASILPVNQSDFGRATRGAALAALAKYHLNSKEWQEAADFSQQVIDLNRYQLIPDYTEVFAVDNEGNDEMIWVHVKEAQNNSHFINATTIPTDFPMPNPNNTVFAAITTLFDEFVNSFEDGDSRTDLIVTEYTNTAGEHVQLLGNDASVPLKYEFDPNANGQNAGNDIPVIRYADILLTRAEALNEINGPTQESIDLINMVRERAGVAQINLGDFSQESLRNHIFQERYWEFYWEQMWREDQIRQGVFISKANERGVNAQEHNRLFPIPQQVINANPEVEQNPGY